jgi:transcriptional regulator with XRE-family HTH domain
MDGPTRSQLPGSCIGSTTPTPRPLEAPDKSQVSGLWHPAPMASRNRAVDVGTERARSIATDLGGEIRRAREQHGLSQAVVGRAAGISPSQVSRIERAQPKCLSIRQIARLLAVVGLELSARAYPAGPAIRDAAHRALLERFRARVAPSVAWRFEVPVGRPGEQRAWDAVLSIGTAELGLEAETCPRDMQSLQRRVALKRRDDPGISGVVLLLANTRYNRALLREHGEALRADFPMPGPALLAMLAAGRDPGGSGVVLV